MVGVDRPRGDAVNALLLIRDLDQAPPKAGEVLVRVGAAGLRASDYRVMHGAATLPFAPGRGQDGRGILLFE